MSISDILYIMGNGPSLGRLSEAEREAIAASDSMAMNAYPRHFEGVGIVPTHYVLLDDDPTSLEVLADVPGIMAAEPFEGVNLWMTRPWYDSVPAGRDRRRLVRHTKLHEVSAAPSLRKRVWRREAIRQNVFWASERFERLRGRSWPFSMHRLRRFWAESLDEPLFCYRGTLTASLNLAWVLGYRDVQLVGVDLNDGMHFYRHDGYAAIKARDDLRLKQDTEARHGTTLWVGEGMAPPVQFVLQRIAELYRRDGRSLFVSNPESLLVREGIIPHRPIRPLGSGVASR